MEWLIVGHHDQADNDCMQSGPTTVTLVMSAWTQFRGGSRYAQLHTNKIRSHTAGAYVNWKEAKAVCERMAEGATLLNVTKDSAEAIYIDKIEYGMDNAPAWTHCTGEDYGRGWSCDEPRSWFTCEAPFNPKWQHVFGSSQYVTLPLPTHFLFGGFFLVNSGTLLYGRSAHLTSPVSFRGR